MQKHITRKYLILGEPEISFRLLQRHKKKSVSEDMFLKKEQTGKKKK